MRDPEGSLEFVGDHLIRSVAPQAAALPFLRAPIARQLVADGSLVDFEPLSGTRYRSPRLPFVSAPFEWCDAQLKLAARLTLEISLAIEAHGFELKDASAWNVIYAGCRPVFCDHLSFKPIDSRQWWAFGQFLRHFVFPLQVSRTTGLTSARIFRMSRDGLQAQETKRLLGLRRVFTRIWPLLWIGAGAPPTAAPPATPAAKPTPARGLHRNLYGFLSWALGGSGEDPAKRRGSVWIDYTRTRTHYEPSSQYAKREVVQGWLEQTQPKRLIDVGANTGEYTRLAAARGISVVALEQDHECVTRIFAESLNDPLVNPVLSNLSDLCGGAGWLGSEHSSLYNRLRGHADMVLMLAVIHHLAISESIPLDMIADFAAELSRGYAIVEFIRDNDPMLGQLAAQRNRRADEFSLPAQEAAFRRRFEFVSEHELAGTPRRLVLMRKLQRTASPARE